MSNSTTVTLSPEAFERLQRLTTPLFDTGCAIEKLLDFWDENAPQRANGVTVKRASLPELWHSPRGDKLPVGAPLRAQCMGETFEASVSKKGICFDGSYYASPSAAAVAVKNKLGRYGRAAQTDGRKFWKIQEPGSGRWIPVGSLEPAEKIDVDALLAELK